MWTAFRAFFVAAVTDRAAALLLFGSLLVYAGLYPSAYGGEIVVKAPVVVVDLDQTAASRRLIARVNAVQQTSVVARVGSVAESQSWLAQGRAVVAVIVPDGFGNQIAQGQTGTVVLAGHGAYLLRTSNALAGVGTAIIQIAQDGTREQARLGTPPVPPALSLIPRPLFNTREGYGAAVFPGVAFMIIHQSLLLGLAVLAGTMRERQGAMVQLTTAQFVGVALAAFCLGMLGVGWFTGMVFWFYDYPRAAGSILDIMAGAALFVGATVAAALALASLFRTRERPLQLGLAVSLPLFFLAGLSWPVEAMPMPLAVLARFLPITAGLELMIGLNQLGGRLIDYWPAVLNLFLLILLFGGVALWRTTIIPLASPVSASQAD